MTINKNQDKSLQHVSIYLQKSVFFHGQLYVAISRVTSRSMVSRYLYVMMMETLRILQKKKRSLQGSLQKFKLGKLFSSY